MNVFWNETAFPLCSATDSCWNRKLEFLASPVMLAVRLPISCTSSTDGAKIAGCTWCCWSLRGWLLPLCAHDRCVYTYVSDTVMSQANGLPLDQGRMVVPSGFPPCRIRPTGSLTAEIRAYVTYLFIYFYVWAYTWALTQCRTARLTWRFVNDDFWP